MQGIKHKELARRLVINAIKHYKQKFILEEDLLNGEDKRKVLVEIDKILEDIKEDRVYRLNLENGRNKKLVEDLQSRLNYICSLEDCNEEFEL